MIGRGLLVELVLAVVLPVAHGQETRLDLSRLPELAEALNRPETAGQVIPFESLREHEAEYRGQVVRVNGRMRRGFEQGAVGTLPALQEAWLETAPGVLTCVVCPRSTGAIGPGLLVEVDGTFLGIIRYQGADGERVAPLVVARSWRATAQLRELVSLPAGRHAGKDLVIAAVLGALVALILGVQHLRNRRATAPPKPLPPDFWVNGEEHLS